MNEQNQPIQLSVENNIALLTMNRGESRNALHPTLIRAMAKALHDLSQREDVSVLVLTGAGPAFSAGLDLEHLSTLGAEDRVNYMRSAYSLFMQLYELPQPTIAAVNGPAIAGGFDLAVFCDLRVAVHSALFGQPEIILGATQFLFPLYTHIGLTKAKEMAMTGIPIDAEEAYRLGLLNKLTDPQSLIPEAMQLASVLASRPRETLFATKQLSLSVAGLDAKSAFNAISDSLDKSLGSEAHSYALRKHLLQRSKDS